MFLLKADAIAARTGDQCITFIPTGDERYIWHGRERDRLQGNRYATKAYVRVPFYTLCDHFAHRALGDADKIAYTPDDATGHEDRQTVVTVGRYLERFGEASGHTREAWPVLIGQFKAFDSTLKLAATADDIGRVYSPGSGPSSCMSGDKGWDYRESPTRAYAGGDLQVAYIGSLGDKPGDEQIAARTVVWPEQKKFVRVYGDESTMLAVLAANGYSRVGDFNGAKLLAMKLSHKKYVMPYIDGNVQNAELSDDEKFFILDRNGPVDCTVCNGVTSLKPQHYCQNCEEPCDDGEDYCEACYNDRWTCAACDETYFDAESSGITNEDGDPVCEQCYRNNRQTCSECGHYFNSWEWTRDERANAQSTELCLSCNDNLSLCPGCDGYTDDLQQHAGEGDEICKDCRAIASRPTPRRHAILLRSHAASDVFVAPGTLLPTPTQEVLNATR